ncbi:hypothetical protein [Streptomyces mutabilis]
MNRTTVAASRAEVGWTASDGFTAAMAFQIRTVSSAVSSGP